jgi:hypothetical protein
MPNHSAALGGSTASKNSVTASKNNFAMPKPVQGDSCGINFEGQPTAADARKLISVVFDPTRRLNMVDIIKQGECPSFSGKLTLTYQIGKLHDGAEVWRIVNSTGKGTFYPGWVSKSQLMKMLHQSAPVFTSRALDSIFKKTSKNNKAFFMALLRGECLIECLPGKQPLGHAKECLYRLVSA